MRLTLVHEHRFYRDSDETVFSSSNYNYEFYRSRYLQVFDEVNILGRVMNDPPRPRTDERTQGPGVNVIDLGSWSGYGSMARDSLPVLLRMAPYLDGSSAVIGVSPGRLSWLATRAHLQRPGRDVPYAIEMIGDPAEAFSSGAHSTRLRPAIASLWPRQTAHVVARAGAVAYVSEQTLRAKYPPGPNAFTTHYSSIDLPDNAIVEKPKSPPRDRQVRAIFIGSLHGLHKGPDVLLEALATCARQGLIMDLTVVGSGHSESILRAQAGRLGIAQHVHFLGQLPAGASVRSALDRADLFVLPSLAEGLPRVVIEAMARGLPAIASNVGGTAEILPPDAMVPPRDATRLAAKLMEVVNDPGRMAQMAARNLRRSRDYRASVLTARRLEFYHQVKDRTVGRLHT